MLNKAKLSREILGLFGVSAVISVFVYGFLSVTADSLVLRYCEQNEITLSEMQSFSIGAWIQSISFAAAVLLFVVLFLVLVGQKIAYLKEIIQGIESLRTHRMNYEIPLEGNNELTELAESINYLSKTERELREKEAQMREERENLIRALSHDIRTPLTAILSYSEYLNAKEEISKQEMEEYIVLVQQKSEQIKKLTNLLLDAKDRTLETIDNGKLLMEQLADEWEVGLEDEFQCEVHLERCPGFSGEFDIQELRRIFDNLASNIQKYADAEKSIYLNISEKDGRLLIEQKNACRQDVGLVESYKIGIDSIRKIAEGYGGHVEVVHTETSFAITIILMEIA